MATLERRCARRECGQPFTVRSRTSRQQYCNDKCRKSNKKTTTRKYKSRASEVTLLGFDPAALIPTVPADWFDNAAVLLKDIPTLCGCTWAPVNYHDGPGKWYLKYRWSLCPALRSHSRPATTSRYITTTPLISLPR